jgi:hypothetical protein
MAEEPSKAVKEPVESVPFNFTKYTGWGSAAGAAAVGIYTALKPILDEGPDPLVTLGLLLAAGAFLLAGAIAAGADVLARAYVTARTVPDPKDPNKVVPAPLVLAEAIEKKSEEPKVISVPQIKKVRVQGEPATLLALKITGDKTEFQVQRAGQDELQWVDPIAVELGSKKN